MKRTPTINLVEITEQETWSEICCSFADAQFPQSFEWGQAKQCEDWQVSRCALTKEGKLCGAAQILLKSYYGIKIAYLPRGPLWQPRYPLPALDTSWFVEVLNGIKAHFPNHFITFDFHFRDHLVQDQLLLDAGLQKISKTPQLTSYIDLTLSEDKLLAQLHSKWRNDLRNACRKQVSVKKYDANVALDDLYAMLGETAERKSFSIPIQSETMRTFLETSGTDQNTLLFAENETGVKIAGALILSFNKIAHYLIGASVPNNHEAFVRGASNALQWEAIKWAKIQGNELYDLEGLDPTGNPGVYHFKKRIGGDISQLKGLWAWARNRISLTILRQGLRALRGM